ncbi:MAG: helix-turn-helix transcriptional regulator [Cytophagales bacterium]|nr:helix-turn-helix transcriptional regulator [Cytophagales bacterium]
MKQIADSRHPFLISLGERVRLLRTKLSMTRRQLSQETHISERHLANLEGGTGNVSVLILVELAKAFDLTVAQLLGESLQERAAQATTSSKTIGANRHGRIALIGLRGAGKSTLGAMLAKDLGVRFIETSREIEQLAGCSLAEIYNLYGEAGYRRLEREALRTIVSVKEPVVIATPGGLVSSEDTFELLLRQCRTVWLQAKPLDHLSRVRAQGDNRPMAATRTTQRAAIDDLKSILESREPRYARANIAFNTSDYDLATCRKLLLARLQSD